MRQTTLPINQLTQQGNFLLAALAGAERIFTVMEEKPEIDEGTVELVSVRENSDGTLTECAGNTGRWAWCDRRRPDVPLEPLHGDVRFHDVSFGYTPDRMILQNLSLYAKPGQKIAFVGSTGAGKTTITNLINRFYEVSGGSITYDGMDVRLIKKNDLRRSLGVVLQDTHLFTGTVADNIRFGKLGATQAEIEKAAKIANADSFIRRLPQGYNTMVTSDGANLSQGQRQLLAIAPAGADFGRGHVEHRHPNRGADPEGHGRPDGGPHGVCHRAPAFHGAQRGRHHRAGAWPYHRARHPRRAAGQKGRVLPAVSRDV